MGASGLVRYAYDRIRQCPVALKLFVDHAEYQRELEGVRHLSNEFVPMLVCKARALSRGVDHGALNEVRRAAMDLHLTRMACPHLGFGC